MMAKEAALKEIKEREQEKSQQINKEQMSQAENRFQNNSTDIRSIQAIPFRLDMADVKQGINRVLSDRSPISHSSETYFTPNGCPFIVVNSCLQTEVKEK